MHEAKKARLSGPSLAASGSPRHPPVAIVLDIEGTVAPISYVTDTLFPYAKSRLRSHLEATYESKETQADLELLRRQAAEDAAAGRNVVQIPGGDAGRDAVVAAAVVNCEAQMAEDRKTTALKALQVR